eukprot:gene16050-21790_t
MIGDSNQLVSSFLINKLDCDIHHSLFIAKCFRIFQDVYQELTAERVARIISNQSIRSHDTAPRSEHDGNSKSSLIYGDIDFWSFLDMMDNIIKLYRNNFSPQNKLPTFVDLGHGSGKALAIMYTVYGKGFSSIHGIEILPNLYYESCHRLEHIKELMDSFTYIDDFTGVSDCCHLSYELGDFSEEISSSGLQQHIEWINRDIVFAHSTCFEPKLMELLALKAKAMKSSSIIITLTHCLVSEYFDLLDEKIYVMSWGHARCYIHRRANDQHSTN